MKEIKIADINRMAEESESCDKDLFQEQRSNVLLEAGEHWTKKADSLFSRGGAPAKPSETQKLRITKNLVHKITRHYKSNILSHAPGVTIAPQMENEIQDQKDAELNKSVWEDAKYKYRIKEKVGQWAGDFITLGECALKLFWDPRKGDVVSYEPEVDENGAPKLDPMGQMVADKTKPVFSGEFVFERVFGFNLRRCPTAKSMSESPYLMVLKMVDLDTLKSQYKGDETKMKFLQESQDETYVVFDSNRAEYTKSRKQTLVRETFFRPNHEMPEGFFVISTPHGILEQGPLPFGKFPIVYANFDEYPTTPRGRSIIKVARPFQAELNRASSAIATHQVTIGDDKILYQQGTKLAPGALLPGVRGLTFQGAAPQILPGRDGSQYLPYIDHTLKELFQAVEMDEEMQEQGGQLDPYTMLFRSMGQQRKFAHYAEKFERFLIDTCELYLELAKQYLPDEAVIYAIGKREQINLAEFRKTSKLCYSIKVEPQTETVETKLGRQLTMNHVLQYVGPQLGKDDIGRIMRNMPFANVEESFSDFTLDYDNAKNEMLALERGEVPETNENDNHEYIINRLSHRMKQSDFRFLHPMIQDNYKLVRQQHIELQAEQMKKILAAKSEAIPTDGALVACDLYVPNPKNPDGAAKRVRIPYGAMNWLVETLERQGRSLETLENMNQGALAELAQTLTNHAPNPQVPQHSPMSGLAVG